MKKKFKIKIVYEGSLEIESKNTDFETFKKQVLKNLSIKESVGVGLLGSYRSWGFKKINSEIINEERE